LEFVFFLVYTIPRLKYNSSLRAVRGNPVNINNHF